MPSFLTSWLPPALHQIPWIPPMVGWSVLILVGILGLLVATAYLTLAERKIIAAMQLRVGPNQVGPWGLLQPLADGIKLLHKEIILPQRANKMLFVLAPMLTFALSLATWAVMPLEAGVVLADINLGVLYIFALSSLGVYGIIIAGWASNSRYAFLGALRSAAQMVSYEMPMGMILVTMVLWSGTMNLSAMVAHQATLWHVVPHFPLFVIFIIVALAETNRAPFDLPEAEGELAGGYNVEYASMPFALFFLGEYAKMILLAALTALLFLGGWLAPISQTWCPWVPGSVWFSAKTAFILFVFIWARAAFPRYRYDQLMRLGWKIFLPFTFLWFVGTAFVLRYVYNIGAC